MHTGEHCTNAANLYVRYMAYNIAALCNIALLCICIKAYMLVKKGNFCGMASANQSVNQKYLAKRLAACGEMSMTTSCQYVGARIIAAGRASYSRPRQQSATILRQCRL